MPSRRIAAVVSPLLVFVDWLFSELAPGVDLFLGTLATAWLVLMVERPDVFDQGSFRGMQWMPDEAWIAFVALTAALHLFGLYRLHSIKLRVGSHLLTSWYWLLVAISFFRVGVTPGIFAYGLIGCAALCSAIYISGRSRRVA